jgi:23S rRNA (adenine2503-C2)-methyltransferase
MNLAWTMLSGVNTSRQDALEIARLTAGMPVRIDLIDVNDDTGQFARPSDQERRAFRDALSEEVRQPVAWRYSGGADVHGACGMLAAKLGPTHQREA